MNYNTDPNQNFYRPPVSDENAGFANAALILGILSIALFLIGFGVFLAPLGIIFGILSRGRSPMPSKAIAGIILSILGLSAGIASIAFSFYAISTGMYDDYIKELEETYSTYLEEQNSPISVASAATDHTEIDTSMEAAYLQMDVTI